MKWMKRLRLINWQYFRDETFEVGNQTQITGPKGVGKSSIVDALQTLIVADQRRIKYNMAAHGESTDRSLVKYIRGDIKGRNVSRPGDVTSYIIAEFWDDKKSESFVIGFFADLSRDDSLKEEYFILSPLKIKDLKFVTSSGTLLSGDEFRRSIEGFHLKQRTFERNKNKYRNAFLQRMGGLPERFFRNFIKALAFQPIKDIRDFVYSYILDPKELNIELMKQNFETYENIRKQLDRLQERKDLLSEINAAFERFSRLRDRVYIQEYVIKRLEYAQALEANKEHIDSIKKAKDSISYFNEQLSWIDTQSKDAMDKRDQVRDALAVNQQKNKWDSLNTEISQVKTKIDDSKRELSFLKDQIEKEALLTSDLFEWSGNEWFQWTEAELELLMNAYSILNSLTSCDIYTDQQKEELREAGIGLSEIQTRVTMTMGTLGDSIEKLNKQRVNLEEEIEKLKDKKLTYPFSVDALKKLLEKNLGNRSRVLVLCEEMDIIDEEWRNAIEGFLNTQKFDLLVEMDCFAEALSLYEKNKREYHIEGVGLVDTEKEARYLGKPRPKSLATLLVTENSIVQARINHLLGNVMMARDEQDLRNYQVAVTKTCMSYNRLVARQINKKSYELPYIGKEALKHQLEIKAEQLLQIKSEIITANKYRSELTLWNKNLANKEVIYSNLADKLSLPETIKFYTENLQSLSEQLSQLDISEMKKLEADLEHWTKVYGDLQKTSRDLTTQCGKATNDLESLNRETIILEESLISTEDAWRKWEDDYPDLLDRARTRWGEAEKEVSTLEISISNRRSSIAGNTTQRINEFNNLTNLRTKYNSNHGFKGEISAQDNNEYQAIFDEIDMDITSYKEKVAEALKQSEEQFRTHFIFGLQEAITAARREFGQLNYALKNFPFNEDKYYFRIEPSSNYRLYYDAIMDQKSTSDTGLLFEPSDDERSETLRDLFNILINGQPFEQEEFKDYRRYLDFDLMYESRGETYSYSKSAMVDSGGENESPFYIIILASFYHMYNSGHNYEAHMRLVIFDEAFSKMDTESMDACLQLVKQLNLQMLIVVPNDKTGYVLPHVSTTWVVNRNGNISFHDSLGKDDIDGISEELKIQQDTFVFADSEI